MIWLYAICEYPELPPPRRRGLAQAPLDALREGQLLAVVTRHVHPPTEPALDSLWVHERVVERLMADRAVLPMRFGSRMSDAGAVHALLAQRQQAFLAALDHVRGRVELGLRVMRAPGANDHSGSAAPVQPLVAPTGREYLLAKLNDGRRNDRATMALHEPLARLAVEARVQSARAPEELLRASYLVALADVSRFRAVVQRLQRSEPDLGILCTGPWPPYSFVDRTLPPAGSLNTHVREGAPG